MGFLGRLRSDPARDARRALDEGRYDEAEALLRSIIAEGSDRSDVWWNLGLVHKFQGQWAPAIVAFRRYLELLPTAEEGYWNLGLAATALRDWSQARWAWRGLGIDVGGGDGPPAADYGPAPIRLNPAGGAEVVWAFRIDPCRARLASVPTPESGHRWGDIVLHDVVPRGQRALGDRSVPVFDELERMDPFPHPTHRAELQWSTPGDEAALEALLEERDLGGENWTANIEFLCASCSLANGHVHAADGSDGVRLAGTWGLAGPTDVVTRALTDWAAGGPGREATPPEPVG